MTTISIHAPDSLGPRSSDVAASWRARWRRHFYIIPSFLIVLLFCAWYATWGDWRLFDHEVFCGFYDAQARSLLAGHLDVPPRAIGIEAFIFRGKTYGYFGIGPALLRVPLVVLFKNMDGRWSRSLMLIACLINLLCAYRILLWIRGSEHIQTAMDRFLNSLFILCVGIGSTNIFIVNRCYTYHEAIMWGATFALLFTVAVMKYLRSPTLRVLAAAGVFAFFSFHSRPTDGAGTLLALGVLTAVLLARAYFKKPIGQTLFGAASIDRPFRHAMVAGVACLLIVSTYFAVNYGKFRTFDGVPVRYYGMYHTDPRRMQVTGGRQIHPENIPTSLATYFGLSGIRLSKNCPWVYPSRQVNIIGNPAIDVVEQYTSVPISMPAMVLLSVLGMGFIVRGPSETLRRLRLPAVALLVGGGIIFMTVGITERYLHDLFPFFVIAGAAGIVRVSGSRHLRWQAPLLAVMVVISIAVNCTISLEYQRLAVWGVSESKRVEMMNVQHAVDRFFHVQPAVVAEE